MGKERWYRECRNPPCVAATTARPPPSPVGLFSLQHHGTHRVPFLFAPIVTAWLLCISGIGVYNIFQWNPSIFCALSPFYMYRFLQNTRTEGWVSLGVVRCIAVTSFCFNTVYMVQNEVPSQGSRPWLRIWAISLHFQLSGKRYQTGDMGKQDIILLITWNMLNFTVARGIKLIAFTFLVYPCLMLAYMGEAAFLSTHLQDIQQSFYKAIPGKFDSNIACCVRHGMEKEISTGGRIDMLGGRETRKMLHTYQHRYPSMMPKYSSQQEVGYIQLHPKFSFFIFALLHQFARLAVTVVMFVTSCLMFLVIIIVWKQRIMVAVAFLAFFGSIELFYISASLTKVHEGGWMPLNSFLDLHVHHKHEFVVENRVSMYRLFNSGPSIGMVRVPVIGVIYTDIVIGVLAVFGHLETNLPAFHQVLVFVCVCVISIQVAYVCEQERFLIGRIGPKEYVMFWCIVRYRYKDLQQENYNFENRLVSGIMEFVETEGAECTSSLNTGPSSGFLSSDGEENLLCLSDFKEVTSDGLEIVENSILRDYESQGISCFICSWEL
ncbi:LOW QUALITY PROTEIN: potassium transporter 1 [Cinnamomum micranthum f. kanehirae]|uniref:Potassium transporter 1 n=1 Tax=Cinnamomum micranthum f. kanehirae TaxID=337451 RepID=A0A443NK22_9MAGN|nr:LOW QUALITY PROTEIN: potassium transporter 1 [Cinnamomum micranthum f. kanehirae]